jgi:bifunctional oligoribonuclease and PAP phosphatase NrnA
MTGMTTTSPHVSAASIQAARDLIAAANRVLIVAHVLPDGDAIGSQLGLGLALRAAGKEVVFGCDDGPPDNFRFLPGADEITATPTGAFDLVIAVDISDLRRMGTVGAQLGRPPHLLFDHHITNPGFADVNLLDAEAASTGELVAELLELLGLPIPQSAATCLLAGVLTDTIGFRTSNTTPKTLGIAQKLMEAGAPLAVLYKQVLSRRSFEAVRLWAEGLTRLREDHGIIWASLTLKGRRASGYGGTGDADLIDILTTVRDAKIAIVFSERTDGTVKVSWRSDPGINVAQLAVSFGGGGHAPAAGAEVRGTLADVERQVILATKALLNGAAPGA